MKIKTFIITISTLLTISGCTQKNPWEPSDIVTFSQSPIAVEMIRTAMPLGNTNPPGHTFPSNHVGFYLEGSDLVTVSAPGDGEIITCYYNESFGDYRIEFRHSAGCIFYLDHVKNLFPGIAEGTIVETGDHIGYGDPRRSAVDLGVVHDDTLRHFINPDRYHEFYVHCVDPYLVFTPEVREELMAKNPRTIEPRGGKIDFDVEGTLSGNWFLESLPIPHSSGYNYAYGHLAFIRDDVHAETIRITCGGTLTSAPFDRSIEGNGPDPVSITQESGRIKYNLNALDPTVLLVQMTGPRTIRAEVFVNKTPEEVWVFTGLAKTYIR